jgi:hypothetical protein
MHEPIKRPIEVRKEAPKPELPTQERKGIIQRVLEWRAKKEAERTARIRRYFEEKEKKDREKSRRLLEQKAAAGNVGAKQELARQKARVILADPNVTTALRALDQQIVNLRADLVPNQGYSYRVLKPRYPGQNIEFKTVSQALDILLRRIGYQSTGSLHESLSALIEPNSPHILSIGRNSVQPFLDLLLVLNAHSRFPKNSTSLNIAADAFNRFRPLHEAADQYAYVHTRAADQARGIGISREDRERDEIVREAIGRQL